MAERKASPTFVTDLRPSAKKTPVYKNLGEKLRKNLKLIMAGGVVVIIVLLAYGYIHTKNQLNTAKDPAAAGKNEIEQIQSRISKVVYLPTDETPTLATVNNAAKLKAQVFFKNAKDGDKVLIFPKAGTAILYRPSTKQVIEYAPVNLGNNQ